MTPKQEELHTLYFQLSEVQRDIANADLQEACRSTICSLRQLEEDFTEEIRLLTDFREPQYCAAAGSGSNKRRNKKTERKLI